MLVSLLHPKGLAQVFSAGPREAGYSLPSRSLGAVGKARGEGEAGVGQGGGHLACWLQARQSLKPSIMKCLKSDRPSSQPDPTLAMCPQASHPHPPPVASLPSWTRGVGGYGGRRGDDEQENRAVTHMHGYYADDARGKVKTESLRHPPTPLPPQIASLQMPCLWRGDTTTQELEPMSGKMISLQSTLALLTDTTLGCLGTPGFGGTPTSAP